MKYSVILPVYNVSNYLERCLNSLLLQEYGDFEIILVNDGSTDNSGEICYTYSQKYDKVKVINQENSGTGAARNKGLEVASGEYIFFCDPDDYVTGNFFAESEEFFKFSPDVIFFDYYDEIELGNGNKVLNRKEFPKSGVYNKYDFRSDFNKLFETQMMYTLWNKLYRREFLVENNLRFTTKVMGQDTRFNLEVYAHLDKGNIVKKAYYHYITERPGSSTSKYRENRTDLKLEEFDLIHNLLIKFDKGDFDLLSDLMLGILVDSVNHVIESQLLFNEKISESKKNVLKIKEKYSDYIYKSKKIQVILLRNNRVVEYAIIRGIYKSLSLIKRKWF